MREGATCRPTVDLVRVLIRPAYREPKLYGVLLGLLEH